MSDKKVEVSYSGVGFFGFLTLLFIGLKLTGYIDWSWWLVIAPIFAPLIFLIGALIVVGVAFMIAVAAASVLLAMSKIFDK